MAVTFRSVGVSPGANGNSCVIVKPVGLAVDDLMVAQIVGRDNEALGSFTPPGGWNTIREDIEASAGFDGSSLYWKIADQADVDAVDLTFTVATALSNVGAIMAWTGHDPSAPINAHNGQGTANSQTMTSPPITPSIANCVIIMFGFYINDGSQQNYAIADDDPGGWTEPYELIKNLITDMTASCGYVTRPETTSTGNGTCDNVQAKTRNIGQLIAISPPVPTNYERSATVAVGLVSLAKVGWGRTALKAIGLVASATRAVTFKRTSIKPIGLVALAKVGWGRTALVSIGLVASATAGWGRTAIKAIGLVSSASRLVTFERTSIKTIGLVAIASRVVTFERTSIKAVGLAALASRLITFERTAVKAVGLVASASRAIGFARTSIKTIGLVAKAKVGHGRTALVAIGLKAWAIILTKFNRRLATFIGRDLATTTHRDLSDEDETRDLQ